MKKDLKDVAKIAAGMYVANRIQERRHRKREEKEQRREDWEELMSDPGPQLSPAESLEFGIAMLVSFFAAWILYSIVGLLAAFVGGIAVFFTAPMLWASEDKCPDRWIKVSFFSGLGLAVYFGLAALIAAIK